jgi:IS30 family transposase
VIRKEFEKNKSMNNCQCAQATQFADRMNNTPLKSLNNLTPNEYAKILMSNQAVAL